MSARGARSRKAVTKDIQKQEKKTAVKHKAVESIRKPHDAFVDWPPAPSVSTRESGMPARQLTISSDASRVTSRTSSTENSSRPHFHPSVSYNASEPRPYRPKTSASGSASISDSSLNGQEKKKYQAKGKETKAPRGRGGGVPIKRAVTTPAPLFRAEATLSYTPTNQRSWIDFKIWERGEKGLRPYGGFDFDEHLQQGNVLIYFKEEQLHEDRPVPQLRAELDVLENSGSTWLCNALLYGRIDDNDDDDWILNSPESSTSQHALSPNFPTPPGQRMLGPTAGGRSPPPFDINQSYYGVPGSGIASRAGFHLDGGAHSGQSPPQFEQRSQQQPTHELWFTAPAHVRTPQAQRMHHVAVRNFIAMLHDKPIVGSDLFEMLNTLQPEIEVMYDLDHDDQSRITPRELSVRMVAEYLGQHKLDDVRNNIKLILGNLAWAEQDTVKWRQGYLESFVHLAGVLNPQIEDLPDFKRLSIVTRRNLEIAAKTLQLKVMEAEEKLDTFDFSDLWMDPTKAAGTAVYQSYQAFRQFLTDHYSRIYGNWPPTRGKTWLNRKMVLDLQQDFGALYDYLVNRDVSWDSREERPGKKWQMTNNKVEGFRADLPDLSLTDMLVTFDNRHNFQHIPHPYPLLPRPIPQSKAAQPQKKGLFGLKKGKPDTTKDAKAHLQLSIIYSDATNIDKADLSFTGSTLIDQFERFELGADLKTTTPREARMGRWLLLYGTLQVLSTLSVDVRSLKYTDGVRYFLCTDLKRCPEWVTSGQSEYLEASQQHSWCWQRSWDPTPLAGAPVELEGNNAPVSGELDSSALDGATLLQNDIRRIGEKINHMSFSREDSRIDARRELEIRRDNEKVMQGEFANKGMDSAYRLTESDYAQRPSIPSRSPLRSSPGSGPHTPSHPWSPEGVPLSSPHEYVASAHAYSPPPQGRRYHSEDRGGFL